MTVGTLRDQVIYPHLGEEFHRRGGVDTELEDILNKVWTTLLLCSVVYLSLFCISSQSQNKSRRDLLTVFFWYLLF